MASHNIAFLVSIIFQATVISPSTGFETDVACGTNIRACYDIPRFPSLENECSCRLYGVSGDRSACIDQFQNVKYNKTFVEIFGNSMYKGDFFRNAALFMITFGNCTNIDTDGFVKLIDRCPEGVSEQQRKLCEEPTPFLPIVDYVDGVRVPFKNIYCAECHGETIVGFHEKLEARMYAYQCNMTHGNPIREMLASNECSMVITIVTNPLFCSKMKHFESILVSDCEMCMMLNGTDQNILFENVQCVLCKIFSDIFKLFPCVNDSNLGGDLTFLFTIPAKEASLIIINKNIFKVSSICADNEQFDTVFSKCRPFSCPEGQLPKSGGCIKTSDVHLPSTMQPLPYGSEHIFVNVSMCKFSNQTSLSMYLLNKTIWRRFYIWLIENKVSGNTANFLLDGSRLSLFKLLLSLSRMKFKLENVTVDVKIQNHWELSQNHSDCELGEIVCKNQSQIKYINEEIFFGISDNQRTFVYPAENVLYKIRASSRALGDDNCFETEVDALTNQRSRRQIDITKERVVKNSVVKAEFSDVEFIRAKRSIQEQQYTEDAIYVYAIEVCVCEVLRQIQRTAVRPKPTKINCSHELYEYGPSEYLLTDDGNLLIKGFTLTQSQFYIGPNLLAFTCFQGRDHSADKFFKFDPIKKYLSWACTGISCICLVFSVIIYFAISELHTLPAKLQHGISLYLLVAQFLLVVPVSSPEICIYLAASTHFSWLSVFTWMSASATHMYFKFSKISTNLGPNSWSKRYYGICTLIPMVIVTICVVLDVIPSSPIRVRYGQVTCNWISDMYGLIYFFFIPVAVSLLINFVCFISALRYIKITTEAVAQGNERALCIIYLKMSSLMGFTWIFGFVAFAVDVQELWYVYIVLNGLQGFFIFVSFHLNIRTRKLLKMKFSRSTLTTSDRNTNRYKSSEPSPQ